MLRIGSIFISCLVLLIISSSCKNGSTENSQAVARRGHLEETISVETGLVKKDVFSRELVSNGRVKAVNRAVVPFRVNEQITAVFVHNGQHVKKGQLLATLEDFTYSARLERAMNQFENARLELEDVLLGHGFYLKDSLRVPEHIWRMAGIRSGHNNAVLELNDAKYQLEGTRIIAPISGIVSELEAKEFNPSSSYKSFCSIVDNTLLEAEFPVLESEIAMISLRQPVEVIPFANTTLSFKGTITGIRPAVNEQGMIIVQALIKNPGTILIDGMNVRVLVKKEIPGQLIIPKDALVLRQGRKVVFSLQDSLAIWNYVETGLENSREFTILKGLEEGQEIIVKGNFNLAHETPVKKIQGNEDR
jgi:multidrug efflux pump subunit AcrA (membrane-fusion protein)